MFNVRLLDIEVSLKYFFPLPCVMYKPKGYQTSNWLNDITKTYGC